MKEMIRKYIEEHSKEMVSTLKELIRVPSPDKGGTKAQEIVKQKLEELGLETEEFGLDGRVKDCPDYCDPEFSYPEGTYNLAGRKAGKNGKRTLMLYGHIDTEEEVYFGCFEEPYQVKEEDGKIIGLGASDDKGGIAMILEALKTAYALKGELDQNIIVLSLLGKHGGAFGTLSAMMKGYAGDDSVYVHPAETGHGFREIKNISLGILDMKLTVYGRPGILHDDLSAGENANILMAKAVGILEDLNIEMREKEVFDFGSFKGKPSFILNVGSIRSEGGPGNICEKAECGFRCRFFFPHSTSDIFALVDFYLKERLEGDYLLEKGSFRAEPAMVSNDDPFVSFIENCVKEATGEDDFIHQYHGGSDIRFPILYGGSRCVGIGPYCELPKKGSGTMEWIDKKDYLKGIEILAQIIMEYSSHI